MVNIIAPVHQSARVSARLGVRLRRATRAVSRASATLRAAGACVCLAISLPAAPLAAQAPGRTVTGVHFSGNSALDGYTLGTSISTSKSGWAYSLPVLRHLGLGQRRVFDELEFRRDVLRLSLFYRQRGFYDARVDTTVRRRDGSVSVTFRIAEGLPVRVDSIAVRGAESVVDTRAILRRLSFRAGQRFDRLAFEGAADTVGLLLRDRGYPFVQVYRSYSVDRTTRLAAVQFDVVLGPRARVGAIRIDGANTVGERTVRRSLATHEGAWFTQQGVYESQRSLYRSGLFRFASVAIAPDSTVGGADSLVRLAVQVAEGPRNSFRLGAGYGTIDCFRAQAAWSAGGFLGGTRRLDVAAKASKLGAGGPADIGLRNTLCPALSDDPFSERVNYVASVALTQPALFARRNVLTVSAFAERRSEYKAYERRGLGGSVEMAFGVGRDIPVTVAYRVSYGRTVADPATFCTFFDRCEQSTVALLSERRRQATVVLAVSRNRANSPLDPSGGSIYSLELTHASPLIGSDSLVVFNKAVGEATWYGRILGLRRWVMALRVRGGLIRPGLAFVADSAIRFVPPEERFYAGGPSTVRGFGRNELGPLVYVAEALRVEPDGEIVPEGLRTSPTGSYAVALANAEIRFPSPVWPSRLRLAAFVDVGRLWDQGERGLVSAGFRVTPGAGVRVVTPLGPLRVDVAYNDYPRLRGPLYVAVPPTESDPGRLELVSESYGGPRRRESLLGRLQLHFSVGQAF